MKRTEITFSQLDRVLRSLGFTWRPGVQEPPGRIYEHKATGAVVMLPAYADADRIFEHHLVATRTELDNFGIANPTKFAAKLLKVISADKEKDLPISS